MISAVKSTTSPPTRGYIYASLVFFAIIATLVPSSCRVSDDQRSSPQAGLRSGLRSGLQSGLEVGGLESRETSGAQEERSLPPLSLSFVGDLMAHPPNFRMSDYSRIYAAVEEQFHDDDLSFINLEFVIDPSRAMAGFPRFNVHRDYVEAAVDAGFDVFSFANNHINDYGSAGIRATRIQQHLLSRYAREGWNRPVYFSGIRVPGEDEFRITAIEHRGWRIAYLSVTGILNQYWDGADDTYLVRYWSEADNSALLGFIKERRRDYDLFILAYHGGTEYILTPNEGKAELFTSLADAGVDVVWGHHPHVLQPVHFFQRPDGRSGAIMYSMGNFVSSQTAWLGPEDGGTRRAYTGDSAIVRLEIRNTPQGPDVRRIDMNLITHLREYDTDDPARDGYEVHFTEDAPGIARKEWKPFYEQRLKEMTRLIGPAPARYYQTTDSMP